MALKRQSITDAVKQEFSGHGLESTPEKGMETFSIRLSKRDRDTLERHFERRGLKVTQGIRMIITEYMVSNGLK